VTRDIVAAWRRPRKVMRRLLAQGQREDRALVFLMLGCTMIALSQVPRMVRAIEMGTGGPFEQQLGGVILAWLFLVPLALYALAAASHLVARMFGGKGAFHSARLALFWSLLAVSPLWLLAGLIEGYFGSAATISQVFGLVAVSWFFYLWIAGYTEVEWGKQEAAA